VQVFVADLGHSAMLITPDKQYCRVCDKARLRMDSSNIVIVGGGFAGTTLAHRLERRLPGDRQLILLSQENCITYNPLLAEVVGASVLPGHVVAPIRQIVSHDHEH